LLELVEAVGTGSDGDAFQLPSAISRCSPRILRCVVRLDRHALVNADDIEDSTYI